MTVSSDSKWRLGMWASVLSIFGVILLVELGLFVLINRHFHKTAGELAGPYVSFAAIPVMCWALAMLLRRLEGHGARPRWLALGWALTMTVFFTSIGAALYYSGVTFHVIRSNEWKTLVLAQAGPTLLFSIMMYGRALKRVSARVRDGEAETTAH